MPWTWLGPSPKAACFRSSAAFLVIEKFYVKCAFFVVHFERKKLPFPFSPTADV
jgi:hypothetical protein